MNITFEPKIDPEPATSDPKSGSSLVTTEFSEARHQLMLKCRYSPAVHKAARAVQTSTGQRTVFAGSSELAEEAFYWFLTAPALVYVVYLVFGF
jgi:hypothetical protein